MLSTCGDPLPSLRGSPQPASARVEVGEGLREVRSETEGREDTVEIEDALVDMVMREDGGAKLGGENCGMKSFVGGKSGLGIFQVPFWDPRIFFGRISFPSDQERSFGWSSAVA